MLIIDWNYNITFIKNWNRFPWKLTCSPLLCVFVRNVFHNVNRGIFVLRCFCEFVGSFPVDQLDKRFDCAARPSQRIGIVRRRCPFSFFFLLSQPLLSHLTKRLNFQPPSNRIRYGDTFFFFFFFFFFIRYFPFFFVFNFPLARVLCWNSKIQWISVLSFQWCFFFGSEHHWSWYTIRLFLCALIICFFFECPYQQFIATSSVAAIRVWVRKGSRAMFHLCTAHCCQYYWHSFRFSSRRSLDYHHRDNRPWRS